MKLIIIPAGVLRNPETGEFLKSPLMDLIVIIIAPVFVPMFMEIGYSPVLTQMAYRIED